jgi:Zn finger protein HypA/HybF involved in hydrogenase expression
MKIKQSKIRLTSYCKCGDCGEIQETAMRYTCRKCNSANLRSIK